MPRIVTAYKGRCVPQLAGQPDEWRCKTHFRRNRYNSVGVRWSGPYTGGAYDSCCRDWRLVCHVYAAVDYVEYRLKIRNV